MFHQPSNIFSKPPRLLLVVMLTLFCASTTLALAAQGGSLDPRFGTNGIVLTNSGLSNLTILQQIAKHGNGILLLYGSPDPLNAQIRFTLFRYLSNGTLDTTFGTNGRVTSDFGRGMDDRALNLKVYRDGRILASGQSGNGNTNTAAVLARYLPNGTLDTTFGTNGLLTINPFGPYTAFGASDIALQPNGTIIILLRIFSDHRSVALARYLPNGTPDLTFGTAGFTILDLSRIQANNFANTLHRQHDGTLIVAGSAQIPGPPSRLAIMVARLHSDGTLDSNFGTNGITITPFPSDAEANTLTIDPHGRLLLAGDSSNPDGTRTILPLLRYRPDGTLDSSFGTGGIVLTDPGSSDTEAYAIAIWRSTILVAGFSNATLHGDYDLLIARYHSNGTLDSTFGTNGIIFTDLGLTRDDFGFSMILTSSNVILGASASRSITERNNALVKYRLTQ